MFHFIDLTLSLIFMSVFNETLQCILVLSCLLVTYGAKKGEVTVVFGGDIEFALKGARNCSYVDTLARLKRYTNDADYFIANLETTIRTDDTETLKPAPGKMRTLDSHASALQALKNAGINWVSIANNHILDYDEKGLNVTTDLLKKNGVNYFGVNYGDPYNNQVPILVERNGLKIGVLAFCDTWECDDERYKVKAGPALFRVPGRKESKDVHAKTIKEIKSLRKKCDVLVLYMHWGAEYTPTLLLPQIESIKRVLRHVHVDLIVGSHPHVTQQHWYVNDTLVAPSLGNLFFSPFLLANKNFGEPYYKSSEIVCEELAYKQGLVMNEPTTFGRLLKVTFDRNGIVQKKTKYLSTRIRKTKQHCLYVDRKNEKTKWRTVCEKGDPECTGTSTCNYIECDHQDPLPFIGL